MINYASAAKQGLTVTIKEKKGQESITIKYCKPGTFINKKVAEFEGCDRESLTNRFIQEF